MSQALKVTTPSDQEVRVEREFNAPAQLVFDCHTKPDYIRHWMLGPPGWSMPDCEIDPRAGGKYLHRWREDATGNQFHARGEFIEVDPPRKIVQHEIMDMEDGSVQDEGWGAHITTTFTERDGKTILVSVMRFPSKEARDAAVATGMTDGMGMSYDLMEQFMAEKV